MILLNYYLLLEIIPNKPQILRQTPHEIIAHIGKITNSKYPVYIIPPTINNIPPSTIILFFLAPTLYPFSIVINLTNITYSAAIGSYFPDVANELFFALFINAS